MLFSDGDITTAGSLHGPPGRVAHAIHALSELLGRVPLPSLPFGVEPSPGARQSTGLPSPAAKAGRHAVLLGAAADGSQPVQYITHSPPGPRVTTGSCAKCGWTGPAAASADAVPNTTAPALRNGWSSAAAVACTIWLLTVQVPRPQLLRNSERNMW